MATQSYVERTIAPVTRRVAREFPALVLTGPRQSGKTTLLKHVFGKSHRYVSIEPPDVRIAAVENPRAFLDFNPAPVIFDEIQYAPELLAYIKERIDASRATPGQYLLTGSQNLALVEGVSESLAGRAAVLELLPLSQRETASAPNRSLPWERKRTAQTPPERPLSYRRLWESLLRGNFPELVAHPKRDGRLWHASYVQTYLERDVRSLRQVGDLTQFQNFLRALAARSTQLLNLADLARDLGIALNTVKAWLSVLEASFQVIILRPYHANLGKRLVKAPKVYFTDVGTLCYLTGLQSAEHAAAGPLGGAIMETAVVMEIRKALVHRGIVPRMYFWRTSTGMEVDVVIETENQLVPVEVKLSATPIPAMAKGIHAFQKDFGGVAAHGYVIHSGDITLPLSESVTALPFVEL